MLCKIKLPWRWSKRNHFSIFKASFLVIVASFKSSHSQLSHEAKIVKTDASEIEVWFRFHRRHGHLILHGVPYVLSIMCYRTTMMPRGQPKSLRTSYNIANWKEATKTAWPHRMMWALVDIKDSCPKRSRIQFHINFTASCLCPL